MTDNSLVLSDNGALTRYAARDDVRELGDRLMAMHPAAGEVGAAAMRAAAQLAILLGANPLPGVNEVHIWKDNKGRNCMSLGINYWRRKAREWGGVLYEIRPRPMRQNEMTEYGIAAGTTAAICRGVRADDMIKFKAAGFTTNEIWSMCGATGIGTQGPNEYAKSGRPGVWTSLKRAETDMLRQLFPAEFGQIDREMVNEDTVVSVVIEGEAVDEEEIGRTPYTLEDANNDLFGSVPGDAQWQAQGEVVNVTPAAAPMQIDANRTYADGTAVDLKAVEYYDQYVAAHDGNAPKNVFNLRNWVKGQKNGHAPAEQPELVTPETEQGNGAYQE